MTSRKKVRRARRHTFGMLAEAEDALMKDEPALALKLVRRALDSGFMNPRVHADAALLLHELGHRDEAIAAGQRALELAPGAEFARAALRLLGLAPDEAAAPRTPAPPIELAPTPLRVRSAEFAPEVARAPLRQAGMVIARAWLAAPQVEQLACLAPDDPAFVSSHPLVATDGRAQKSTLRPGAFAWLDAALAELFACAAEVANGQLADLGVRARFPPVCGAPPPHVERAVHLRLEGGAAYPATERRDLGERATFPLRGLLALGPASATVVLTDLRPGKRRERQREVPAGCAALFCARERPVVVGGVVGLQAVAYQIRSAGAAAFVLTSWADVVLAGPG